MATKAKASEKETSFFQGLAAQCPKKATNLTLGADAALKLAADLGANGVHSSYITFESTSANRDNKRDKRDPEEVPTSKTVFVTVDPFAPPALVEFS